MSGFPKLGFRPRTRDQSSRTPTERQLVGSAAAEPDQVNEGSYRSDPEKERKLQYFDYEPEDKPGMKGETYSVEERVYGGEGQGDSPVVMAGGPGRLIDVEEEAVEIVESSQERSPIDPDAFPPEPIKPGESQLEKGKQSLETSGKDSPTPHKRTPSILNFSLARTWSTWSIRFVDRPSDEYECPICYHVVRDPYLTNCCGTRFCKKCIVEWKDQNNTCPICREEDFRCMPDKRLRREIRGMNVHCRQQDKGCQWIGTYNDLRHHSAECEYEVVTCSKCSEVSVPRKELLDHQQNACFLRRVSCEFCQWEGTYRVVQLHKKRCGLVPQPCPNECGAEPERHSMEQHLDVCPLQEIECDFKHVGCPVRIQRRNLRQHMQDNVTIHVMKMAWKLGELRQMNTGLRRTFQEQHLERKRLAACVESLKLTVPTVPFDFTYSQYTKKEAAGRSWTGPSFYTHYKGYKLCPKIYPKGHDHGKAHFRYMSVFFVTLRGEYDEDLHWPVQLDMTVEIANPNYPDGEPWRPDPPTETFQINRINLGHLGGRAGWKVFIKPSDAQEYLKEDCLHFRVTNVEIREVE